MSYRIKIVAQLEDIETGKIIKEQVVQQKSVELPTRFDDFGLRHKDQIELLKKSQDFILKFECQLFSEKVTCPQCGGNPHKRGKFTSDFHDVFTDHQVIIQRLICQCGWRNHYTLNGIYGSAIHPELAQLQSKHAANKSFEKAGQVINDFSYFERKINNHSTLSRTVNKVGQCLDHYKKSPGWTATQSLADELVVVVDGGHVQNREMGKQSFEEMITTVFRPEAVILKPNGRKEIKEKISVASAKKDSQRTIKLFTKQACLRSGMNKETIITALTDGAKNCWSIVNTLSHECAKVIKVLDWFHVGKKFKERETKIPEEWRALYNKGKWHCWHGHPKTGIIRLNQLIEKLPESEAIKKVKELMTYIVNNESYMVNYHARKLNKLPYSSQLAENSVNCVINDRQKNKKMQWSRSGAHEILQIRTSLYSKTWQEDWNHVKSKLYRQAA